MSGRHQFLMGCEGLTVSVRLIFEMDGSISFSLSDCPKDDDDNF